MLEPNWTPEGILTIIANSPYHALIDTGALITGLTNVEVARKLLVSGLPSMDGKLLV
jgi:hypothetical protein